MAKAPNTRGIKQVRFPETKKGAVRFRTAPLPCLLLKMEPFPEGERTLRNKYRLLQHRSLPFQPYDILPAGDGLSDGENRRWCLGIERSFPQ